MASRAADRRTVRLFRVIWVGQLCAALGSSLTGFVLGVWVFQLTGSATQFAVIFMAASLPGVLAAPFAGAIVDKLDRRIAMLVGNIAGAAVIATLAVLLWSGQLEVWHLYLTAAAAATCNVLHTTAFLALMPQLVPTEQLGKANGLLQITQAGQIAAPMLAGVLLATIGLRGVIVIDLGTTLVAIAVLLVVKLDRTVTRAPGTGRDGSFFRDLGAGWAYLLRSGPLLRFVAVFAGFNFCFALGGVLVQPLILSFSDEVTLGVLMFCGGAGFFAGSLVMSIWGGPRRRVRGMLVLLGYGGVMLGLHGLHPSALLIAVVAPLFLVTLPILNATSMALVQTRVPAEVLGRVLAAVRMAGQAAMPVAYAMAGPLADRVAEPAMVPGTRLGDSLGSVIGTGPGRGIALIFCVAGLAMIVLGGLGAFSRRLRELDTDLPDPGGAGDAGQVGDSGAAGSAGPAERKPAGDPAASVGR